MSDYLHEIWYGNINPAEEKTISKETYAKIGEIVKRMENAKKRLAEILDEENLALLQQFDSDVDELVALSEEDGFVKGCVFIGNIMISLFRNSDNING